MSYYDAKSTSKQLRDARKFPWGEDILKSTCMLCGEVIKDCHFGFFGIASINGWQLTVATWLELHPTTGQPRFFFTNDPWHRGQPHIDMATMQGQWYLLHKDIVPGSTDKTPEDQARMLPPEYEVPTTIVEVSKDLLVFQKTGEYPNESRWATCTERTVNTGRVPAGLVSCVGPFDKNGLYVRHWRGNPTDSIGVAASRKFPN